MPRAGAALLLQGKEENRGGTGAAANITSLEYFSGISHVYLIKTVKQALRWDIVSIF